MSHLPADVPDFWDADSCSCDFSGCSKEELMHEYNRLMKLLMETPPQDVAYLEYGIEIEEVCEAAFEKFSLVEDDFIEQAEGLLEVK